MKEITCVICGKPIVGFPNNARPVKNGVCCADCNSAFVIPARLKLIKDYFATKRN